MSRPERSIVPAACSEPECVFSTFEDMIEAEKRGRQISVGEYRRSLELWSQEKEKEPDNKVS